MTLPLLVGLDGTQKMSKSLGNHIGVLDSAKDMFGKVMSIPDSLIETYYNLLVNKNTEERKAFLSKIKSDPRNAKAELAVKIAAGFHGLEKSQAELDNFNRVFRDKKAPENPDEFKLNKLEIWIVDLLRETKAVSSGSDARRLIEQGAVEIDGARVTDPALIVKLAKPVLLKAGKKIYLRISQS